MSTEIKPIRKRGNPTGKGGFADHPENRFQGGWRHDQHPVTLFKHLSQMTPLQLNAWRAKKGGDQNLTMIERICVNRLRASEKDLASMKDLLDRTVGKPAQLNINIDTTEVDETLKWIMPNDNLDDLIAEHKAKNLSEVKAKHEDKVANANSKASKGN